MYTEKCKIIWVNPFDMVALAYLKENDVKCGSLPVLVKQNDTHLIVDKTKLVEYNWTKEKSFNCQYRMFKRYPPRKNGGMEYRVLYVLNSTNFNDSLRMYEGYYRVECWVNESKVYKDYFVFFNETKGEGGGLDGIYNVVIYGLDGVSRSNFVRQMPLTRDFLLNDLGALEFVGINVNGPSSFQNLFVLFTGLKDTEKPECTVNAFLDNCTYVWEHFVKNGFTKTVYAEDYAKYSTFGTDGRKGFFNQPTDHYWVTFSTAIENEGNYQLGYCLNKKTYYNYIMDYTLRSLKYLKGTEEHFFGFYWSSSMTHDFINYPKKGDQDHKEFLQNLKQLGIFNNTIFIVMSDHGNKIDTFTRTKIGKLERNRPMFFLILPESFKRNHPEAVKVLKNNTKKMVTFFDVHETLKDISLRAFSPSVPITWPHPRGISLFLPIPTNRTCETAGIAPNFCACSGVYSKNVDFLDEIVQKIVTYSITIINEKIKPYPKCAFLSLQNITKAQFGSINQQFYTIEFDTTPGGAPFQVTVICDNCVQDYQNVTPTIIRLNRYREQSWCVDDHLIQPYCYCYF